MSDVSYERKRAVDLAWRNEKNLVEDGKGTRDWSQKEQREIIVRGKAKGYQGHHMKSVDGHNSKAGDPNNIQFLTRKEHLAAHKGNYRNNTNGRYDPTTGKMHEFGRYKANIESKSLSQPLNESQRRYATKKAEVVKAEKRGIAREKAAKHKVNKSERATRTQAKSKTGTQSKTLASQRSSKTGKTSNAVTKSKTLSSQHSSSTANSSGVGKGASKGNSSSGGRSASSGKGASSGVGTSSGKGASHGR